MSAQDHGGRTALLSIPFRGHTVNYQSSRARDQASLELVGLPLLVRAAAGKDRIYNCRLCI